MIETKGLPITFTQVLRITQLYICPHHLLQWKESPSRKFSIKSDEKCKRIKINLLWFHPIVQVVRLMHYLGGFLDFRGPFSFKAYLSYFQPKKRGNVPQIEVYFPPLSIFYPYIQISKKENYFVTLKNSYQADLVRKFSYASTFVNAGAVTC